VVVRTKESTFGTEIREGLPEDLFFFNFYFIHMCLAEDLSESGMTSMSHRGKPGKKSIPDRRNSKCKGPVSF
jgi:hypothetical protein